MHWAGQMPKTLWQGLCLYSDGSLPWCLWHSVIYIVNYSLEAVQRGRTNEFMDWGSHAWTGRTDRRINTVSLEIETHNIMQFLCSFSPSSSLFSQFRWLLLMVALITPVFNFKWEEASKQGLRKHPRVKSILPTEVSAGCLAVHCVHPPQQHIYHSWTMRGKWPNWPIIQKQKCRFCIMSVGEMCRIGCCWTEASVGVLLLLRGDLIFRVIGLVLFTPVRFSC